jgi:hypothetical protein
MKTMPSPSLINNDNDDLLLMSPAPPNLLTPTQFNNDNDLSYHSTQSYNESTTPLYQHSYTTSIPNPIISNQSTTTTHQLQSQLLQLTSCLNHIDLANNDHIDSLNNKSLIPNQHFNNNYYTLKHISLVLINHPFNPTPLYQPFLYYQQLHLILSQILGCILMTSSIFLNPLRSSQYLRKHLDLPFQQTSLPNWLFFGH